MFPRMLVAGSTVAILIVLCGRANAQPSSVTLELKAGHPFRVALDEKVSIKRVGQPVTGTVVEAVWAYDRIVVPAGTRVRGHIARIDSGSRLVRARAYLGGDLSPPRHAILQFDALLLDDGREIAMQTVVTGGVPNVERQVAGGSDGRRGTGAAEDTNGDNANDSLASRAKTEVRQRAKDAVATAKQHASDALAAIKQPGRMERAKDALVARLPYHPQYLTKGLVYDAELTAPVAFGVVTPAPLAPEDALPAPDSILTARLATALDSSKTPRGTPLEAVITEPVFSADRELILPEGTTISGEVTLARQAQRFHRNGQLRFLFEHVQAPDRPSSNLLAALYSVQAGHGDHVALDDEGGATLENPKTRFIEPALGVLALRASITHDGHRYADPDGDGTMKSAGSGAGSRGMGGFLGFGLLGAAVGQITRPIGIGLAVYGASRSVYANVLGKGREVSFPVHTPIQVRLAPGPSPAP
jgi:hypothetical protein